MNFIKEFFEYRKEYRKQFNISFAKYRKCRKFFRAADEKLKTPMMRKLVKMAYIKNL